MYLSNHENLIENIKSPHQKNIILDYGGPNIGKPLHVGHLRSLNIGRSLYNINKIADENYNYNPSSPYSASKAGADQLIRSYGRTYGIKTLIANPCNCLLYTSPSPRD